MAKLKKTLFYCVILMTLSLAPYILFPVSVVLSLLTGSFYIFQKNEQVFIGSIITDRSEWVIYTAVLVQVLVASFILNWVMYLGCASLPFVGDRVVTSLVMPFRTTELSVGAGFTLIVLGWLVLYKVIKPYIIQIVFRSMIKKERLSEIKDKFSLKKDPSTYTRYPLAVESVSYFLSVYMFLHLAVLMCIIWVVGFPEVIKFLLPYIYGPILLFTVCGSAGLIRAIFFWLGALLSKLPTLSQKTDADLKKRSLLRALFNSIF